MTAPAIAAIAEPVDPFQLFATVASINWQIEPLLEVVAARMEDLRDDAAELKDPGASALQHKLALIDTMLDIARDLVERSSGLCDEAVGLLYIAGIPQLTAPGGQV